MNKIFLEYEGQYTLPDGYQFHCTKVNCLSCKLGVLAKKKSILFLRKVLSSRNVNCTHCANTFRLMHTMMRMMCLGK